MTSHRFLTAVFTLLAVAVISLPANAQDEEKKESAAPEVKTFDCRPGKSLGSCRRF